MLGWPQGQALCNEFKTSLKLHSEGQNGAWEEGLLWFWPQLHIKEGSQRDPGSDGVEGLGTEVSTPCVGLSNAYHILTGPRLLRPGSTDSVLWGPVLRRPTKVSRALCTTSGLSANGIIIGEEDVLREQKEHSQMARVSYFVLILFWSF